ncbi:uncharacterized protein PAC_18231 [Phialocephala subalpina]|uniref:Uncharacterized protein n=1 Tax=Phialocephala subalpina TaxID=576137 RepID=A0A1L7XTH5_9HELO|nr:uncharacterized protein PAC_18231 [Phialocephala subalpina]
MRKRATFTTLFILVLSIVSTTFVFLALTSKEWAIQKYYLNSEGEIGNGANWTKPSCHANRSPFYRCEVPDLNTDTNTCPDPSCKWYRAYGKGATSCILASESHNQPDSPNVGGEQECQEVHWSGNLQIAACVFITIGLILLLPISLANLLVSTNPNSANKPDVDQAAQEAHDRELTSEATQVTKAKPRHRHSRRHHSRLSPITPYLVLLAILSLYIGASLQIFAQFFGVLGLTVNATPTAGQVENNNSDFLGSTPWMMDKALTAYATVTWTLAVTAATLMGLVYRIPRWPKLI